MNDLNELHYLAGFFDGEGCIDINRYGGRTGPTRWRLRLRASQLNPEPLMLFKERFGGTVSAEPRARAGRTLQTWTASSNVAIAALKELLPYLRVKRAEADLALRYKEEVPSTAKGAHHTMTPLEVERTEYFYSELQRLKKTDFQKRATSQSHVSS